MSRVDALIREACELRAELMLMPIRFGMGVDGASYWASTTVQYQERLTARTFEGALEKLVDHLRAQKAGRP